MSNRVPLKLALIGNGAIASVVARHCKKSDGRLLITGAIGLPTDVQSVDRHELVSDLAELMQMGPALVVECAGQDAVRDHGPAVLKAGVDLMVISVGAFADAALSDRLGAAAKEGGARVIVPSGALAGLDAVSAAAGDRLDTVTLTTRKPPQAWSGAPGVEGIDLAAITEPTEIFSGTARQAAKAFPKNANVAAALGLAGIGLDATRVTLIADPAASRNSHHVEADGAFGRVAATVEAEPSPDNPKTSYLAALSITRMLDRLSLPMAI